MAQKKSSEAKVREYCCEHLPFADKEDYKRLRTNIRFSVSTEESSAVIGITSAQPAEGKSLTAINLAYSFAQIPDKHVILIDCDMRRPSVSARLGFNRAPGLSNILSGVEESGGGSAKKTYVPSDSSQPFDVITCGRIPPNPSELLASERMSRLLDKLKAYYDFIILDLPPVDAVSDAQIVSTLADGILIVMRESFCTRPVLDECLNQLQIANANILGFVLNGSVETASRKYRYKKYSRYGSKYGYSYGKGYGGAYGNGDYSGYGYGYGEHSGYGYGGHEYGQKGDSTIRYRSNPEDAKPIMSDDEMDSIF